MRGKQKSFNEEKNYQELFSLSQQINRLNPFPAVLQNKELILLGSILKL